MSRRGHRARTKLRQHVERNARAREQKRRRVRNAIGIARRPR